MSLYKRSGRRGILGCRTPDYTGSNGHTYAVHYIDRTKSNHAYVFECYPKNGFAVHYLTLKQVLDKTDIVKIDMSAISKRTNIWQDYRKPKFNRKEFKANVII